MSSKRKRTPRRSNTSLGATGSTELLGGLPTGARFEGAEVIQDRDGFAYAQGRRGENRRRRPTVVDVEEQIRNPLTYILALPGVQESMAEPGALKTSDTAKLKMVSKELRDNVGLQEAVAAGTLKRLKGRYDQLYLYRYDPVYRHPQTDQHNFNTVQALNIPQTPQGAEHSNTTFPQQWTLASAERLTPTMMRELERAMADRGVGGAPFYTYATQTARVDLAKQLLPPNMLYQAHLANRYEMPRNRRELFDRSRRRSDIYGDGTLLFDPLGTPGVVQNIGSRPAKVSRYQIAGAKGPQRASE